MCSCSSARLSALSPYYYSLYHREHYFIKGSHKLLISLSVSPCEEDLLCAAGEESEVFLLGQRGSTSANPLFMTKYCLGHLGSLGH